MIKFTIPIDATPQGRVRFNNTDGKVKAFDPSRSRNFKLAFGWLVKSQRRDNPLLNAQLKLTLKIYRNFNSRAHGNFGDIDNLAKGIMDAMTGIIWKDDRQIVELHAWKFISDNPHVEVIIEDAEND